MQNADPETGLHPHRDVELANYQSTGGFRFWQLVPGLEEVY